MFELLRDNEKLGLLADGAAFAAGLLFALFLLRLATRKAVRKRERDALMREQELAKMGAPISAAALARIVIVGGGLFIALLLGVWRQVVPAVIIGVFCLFIIKGYGGWVERRYYRKIENGLTHCLDIWVRCLRTGLSLQQTINVTVQDLRGPIQWEMAQIQKDTHISDLNDALWRWHDRLPIEDVRFVVIGIITCRQTGAKLSVVMENISLSIHARIALREKVNAITALGKTEAYAMIAIPPIICLIMYLMEPKLMDSLFYTAPGIVGTLAFLAWESVGIFIIWRIVNFKA